MDAYGRNSTSEASVAISLIVIAFFCYLGYRAYASYNEVEYRTGMVCEIAKGEVRTTEGTFALPGKPMLHVGGRYTFALKGWSLQLPGKAMRDTITDARLVDPLAIPTARLVAVTAVCD